MIEIDNIVENYQGKFAKVINVTESGHTNLSAWVNSQEMAEKETVAVSFLNDFGLSQVLKDGANVEEVEEAPAVAVEEEGTKKKAK